MKRSMIAALFVIVLLSASAFAFKPAVVGGIRDGVALGIMLDTAVSNPSLRMGVEADTASSPVIGFVGGKWFLNNVRGGFPMYLSGGLVGYLGGREASAGPYISLIFERFLNVEPLFLEAGVDVAGSGHLQLQVGYFY